MKNNERKLNTARWKGVRRLREQDELHDDKYGVVWRRGMRNASDGCRLGLSVFVNLVS